MRKVLIIFFVVSLLLLDYAALDDITTSKQPHYFFEYLALILSVVVFTALGYHLLNGKRKQV